MSGFRPERLIELREARGWSQSELGRQSGVGQSTINRLEQGETRAPRNVFDIAEALGTSPDYLLGRTDDPGFVDGQRPPPSGSAQGATEQNSDEVEIDSHDLRYGMGGTFVDIEPGAIEIAKAKFSRAWLRKFTHSAPEMLFTTSGIGDSMRPTIEDGDIVIVDRSQRLQDSLGERIWAVVFGGVGMIKRLRPMPDGTVKIMSDNQSVRDDIATDGDLHIVGRVVAKVSRL